MPSPSAALAMEPLLPLLLAMAPRTSLALPLPHRVIAAPAQHAAKVCCPVFLDAAPFQNRCAQVHPAGHICWGHTSMLIADPTAPWPSSAPLQPAATAVIIVPATGLHGQCHHPGKPVQAGGIVGQVDPACTHQMLTLPAPTRCIKALLARVSPLPFLPLFGREDNARSTHTDNSPRASVHAVF